jgi:hypothetical protein
VNTQTSPPQEAVPFETAAQSPATTQAEPGAHRTVQLPPQSTSDSSPSFTRSVQEAAQNPLVHSPLMHPGPPLQAAPAGHFEGQLPPQSTAVSSPSLAPLEHALDAQEAAAQTPLAQSEALPHWRPSAHFWGQPPPQSGPLSDPLRTRSLQVACWQTP